MTLKKYLPVLLVGLVAFSVGRFLSPKKIETREVEKVVYRERVETEKKKNVKEVTKETTLPDGTKIVERVKEDKSETSKTIDSEGSSERISEKRIENRSDWRVTAIYLPPLPFQSERYGAIVERRLLSEIYAGLVIQTDKTIGVSISLGF